MSPGIYFSGLRRVTGPFAILFALLAAFLFSISWNDRVIGFLGDDAIFLLRTELYSPWLETSHEQIFAHIRRFSFPPLYPFLLGWLGVSTTTPVWAATITVGLLVLALWLSGLFIRRETGLLLPGLVIPLLITVLPGTILFSQGLWSEFLFMCFLYAGLCCLAGGKPDSTRWLLAALLFALASLTRSVGVVFILAYGLVLFLEKPRNWPLLAVISATPFIFWNLLREWIIVGTAGHSYWRELIYGFDNGKTVLIEYFSGQPVVFADTWYWLFSAREAVFSGDTGWPVRLSGAILLLLCLRGFYARLRKGRVDALAMPFYLGVIFVWPYTGVYFVSRFFYPLLPLFVCYIWFGIFASRQSARAHYLLLALACISITVLAAPNSRNFISRAYTDIEEELMPYRRSRFWLEGASTETRALALAVQNRDVIAVLQRLTEYVPEQDCIYAPLIPMVMLYARRAAFPFPDDGAFGQCRFILAPAQAAQEGLHPPLYPLGEVPHHIATKERRSLPPPFYPIHRIADDGSYRVIPFYSEWYYPERKLVALLLERLLTKPESSETDVPVAAP